MTGKDVELDATTLDGTNPSRSPERRPMLHVVFSGGVIHTGPPIWVRGEVVAGRQAPTGGLLLAGDGQASRHHAKLTATGRAVSIEDLGSRNGVFVGGERIEQKQLVDGDVIRIGSTLAVLRLEDPSQLDVPDEALVGGSPEMRSVRVAVRRVAKRDATVLLLGETGTGKEVVARAIHEASQRSGPYVAVNCAGVQASLFESELFGHAAGAFTGAVHPTDGYFRAARGGTLLLDEVGDMPLGLNAKLLRALETGSVVPVGTTAPIAHGARVVAATNRDLMDRVEGGEFREDLYARLAQLVIELAPLRRRREDVLAIFAKLWDDAPPLSPSLAEAMLNYHWPRNVRELVAIVTELRSRADDAERLELEMVEDRLVRASAAPEPSDTTAEPPPPDRQRLEALLHLHEGNVTAVAREVGRSRTQVYRLIEQHGLDAKTFRTS